MTDVLWFLVCLVFGWQVSKVFLERSEAKKLYKEGMAFCMEELAKLENRGDSHSQFLKREYRDYLEILKKAKSRYFFFEYHKLRISEEFFKIMRCYSRITK